MLTQDQKYELTGLVKKYSSNDPNSSLSDALKKCISSLKKIVPGDNIEDQEKSRLLNMANTLISEVNKDEKFAEQTVQDFLKANLQDYTDWFKKKASEERAGANEYDKRSREEFAKQYLTKPEASEEVVLGQIMGVLIDDRKNIDDCCRVKDRRDPPTFSVNPVDAIGMRLCDNMPTIGRELARYGERSIGMKLIQHIEDNKNKEHFNKDLAIEICKIMADKCESYDETGKYLKEKAKNLLAEWSNESKNSIDSSTVDDHKPKRGWFWR